MIIYQKINLFNYKMSSIEKIFAREIIDSRGTPTVEVEVCLEKV